MARKIRTGRQLTGLYHAREARHMSRSRTGAAVGRFQAAIVAARGRPDQDAARPPQALRQASRLHAGADFAVGPLSRHRRRPYRISDVLRDDAAATSRSVRRAARCQSSIPAPASAAAVCRRARCARTARHADPIKAEGWVFPASFRARAAAPSPARLLVLDTNGDSMAPTVVSGDRVVVDTGHKTPTPDGLYAIRDTFRQHRRQATASDAHSEAEHR